MPGEDVDRSPFARRGECHLGQALPARASEDREDLLDERGVVRIEQPVGRLALPIDANDESGVERRRDTLEGVDGHSSGATALDTRDQRLRNTDPPCEIELPPAPVDSKRTNDATDPHGVHAQSIGVMAYRAVR